MIHNKLLIRLFIFKILVFAGATSLVAQRKYWSKDEEQFYLKLKSMCEYYSEKRFDTAQRDIAFKEFVYFDNVLKDTSASRIRERITFFDGLFVGMLRFIDSVGAGNLDALPVRLFKNNKELFEPFDIGGELSELQPITFVYFNKHVPDKPLGFLLFEKSTHKLSSWVLINQGGYRYFLTFNLL
ncbi:MAG: hypothetical protein ACTHLE_03230 [Agriterribacter sp.]